MNAPTVAPDAADIYQDVQRFYARQMQSLDDGATEEWAQTFTEDGTFGTGGLPEPVRGRAAIAAGAKQVADQYAEAGVVRRHWVGMLTVQPRDDGSVHARCYALVLEIPKGGEVIARRSTVCEDVLVPATGTWLVHQRRVTRDGLD